MQINLTSKTYFQSGLSGHHSLSLSLSLSLALSLSLTHTQDGMTAVQLAERYDNSAVVAVLKEHMAQGK
jgi:hypothetical protein